MRMKREKRRKEERDALTALSEKAAAAVKKSQMEHYENTAFEHITVVTVTFTLVNPTSHVEDVKKNQRVGQKRACSDNDEEKGDPENRTKKNKKEKTTTCVLPEDPTPEPQLPGNFMTRIKGLNGSEIALVVQKKLFASNVSKSQCHILMSYTQREDMDFLRPKRDSLKKIPQKEVLLIDPLCQKE
ncbi:uncharacterized protein LOC130788212 [Actinidia eriantha]|uniref:uncharacterized protein LOC130788212 n=1 Tax=Actinidia eriantha TaxID=165200 RepID=UPI0025901791|nr:uncharacterized protein LOC130788212 [Actinidia eriantha]